MTGYPSIDKPWLKYYSEEATEAEVPNSSIYEHLYESNRDRLDEVAISYLGRETTFNDLFSKIKAAARAFKALGVEQGDIVTLALPNIPENLISVYALNYLGAIPDLIDLRSSAETLSANFKATDAKVAVACNLFLDSVLNALPNTKVHSVIVASPYDALPKPFAWILNRRHRTKRSIEGVGLIKWSDFLSTALSDDDTGLVKNPSDTACILHTSGTTGEPKAVLLSNKAFNAMTVQYRNSGLSFTAGDSFLNQVPPFLAYNIIMAVHLPLCLQTKVIILPDYKPDDFANRIMKYRPNHVIAGPADWSSFLGSRAATRANFDYLKTLASGSDTMRAEVKASVNDLLGRRGCQHKVIEGYGMTEVGSAACTNLPQCDIPGTVGIPLPLMNFCVWDSEGKKELPFGSLGEICMTGPTVMQGYLNDLQATEEILVAHPDGLKWIHSGDLGFIDSDGRVHLEGRVRRIIVRHDGIKVSPFEIERTVLAVQGISKCCVVGIPDYAHQQGQNPYVWVVVEEGCDGDRALSEVERKCTEGLQEKQQPHAFQLIDDLPLTANGKVDYRELERRAAELAGGDVS